MAYAIISNICAYRVRKLRKLFYLWDTNILFRDSPKTIP